MPETSRPDATRPNPELADMAAVFRAHRAEAAKVVIDAVRPAFAQVVISFRHPYPMTETPTEPMRRAAMLAARQAHRADGYRDPRHEPRPPSVCRHCEMPERSHGYYPHPDPAIGWHYYTPPTNAQILARMHARRATRQES